VGWNRKNNRSAEEKQLILPEQEQDKSRLSKQSNPGMSFLQNARTDLAAEYDALHQPEEAAKYRAALSVPGGVGHEAAGK